MKQNLQQRPDGRNTSPSVTLALELRLDGGERWIRALIDGVDIPDAAQQRAVALKIVSAAMHYLAQTSDAAEGS